MAKRLKLIAEFCQNHNGSFDTLRRMIDAAAEGGATHGKIQTIFSSDLSERSEFEKGEIAQDGRVVTIKRPYQAEYERLKKLELTYEQHAAFIRVCSEAGIEPLTTAFTLTAVPHLRGLGWRSVKVASYDCGSMPLIELLANTFDELIVSTGATYDDEIEATSRYLNSLGKDFTFLHCVTIYPTPLDQMHLNRIKYLYKLAPSVGLSDHSKTARDGVKSSLAAIHCGATAIERHFTILPEDETKDGPVSITKDHLREISEFAKLNEDDQRTCLQAKVPEFEAMLGDEQRILSPEEELNRAYYRGRFCNKVDGSQIYNWENGARDMATA